MSATFEPGPEMGYEKDEGADGLLFVLLVYGASRFFYLVAGDWLAKVIPVGPFYLLTSDVPFGTMNIWSHWDGEHYVDLASSGYLNPPDNVSPAFFPLYPLLMRSFAELFGGPLSPGTLSLWGVLISLLALPFALYFIYRIAEDGWGSGVARTTVLTLALFPTSFFLNAAYTESLFLAFSAGSLWAVLVRRDLLLACLLAALAMATRNVGVFLLAPLAYEWFRAREHYGWRGAYLALASSGLVLYAAYLWWRFGEPLLFYTEQSNWNRRATNPLSAYLNAVAQAVDGIRGFFNSSFWADPSVLTMIQAAHEPAQTYNLMFLILAVTLLILGLRVLPFSLGAYSFLLLVPAVLYGTPGNPLMGMPRYALVAFPLFIVLGTLLKKRWVLGGWLVLSVVASLVLCALFVTWRYVA